MSRARRSINWENCIGDIAEGLRDGDNGPEIIEWLNRTHNFKPPLTKNNFVSGMREQDERMSKDGPIVRLLRSHYPDEAEELIKKYRKTGRGKAAARTPGTPSPISSEVRQPKATRTVAMKVPQYACDAEIADEATGEKRPCGVLSPTRQCRAHRSNAFKDLAARYMQRLGTST